MGDFYDKDSIEAAINKMLNDPNIKKLVRECTMEYFEIGSTGFYHDSNGVIPAKEFDEEMRKRTFEFINIKQKE